MASLFDALPKDMVEQAASTYKLDPRLVAAISLVESSGNRWLNRFEPKTNKYVIDAPAHAKFCGIDVPTEVNNQMTSWGYMQVMGFRARELGFALQLTMLADPYIGLVWGCRSIRARAEQFNLTSVQDMIAAHNRGSIARTPDGFYVNQEYVNKVLTRLARDA